uniref:inositol-1,3,4-trisphosphate 5/6-kinase n=1 Tax=Leersia perrieri TaxID=77586 RepID=A0A0D9XFR0_9ORYZ
MEGLIPFVFGVIKNKKRRKMPPGRHYERLHSSGGGGDGAAGDYRSQSCRFPVRTPADEGLSGELSADRRLSCSICCQMATMRLTTDTWARRPRTSCPSPLPLKTQQWRSTTDPKLNPSSQLRPWSSDLCVWYWTPPSSSIHPRTSSSSAAAGGLQGRRARSRWRCGLGRRRCSGACGVHEGLLSELQNHNWTVIVMANDGVKKNSGVLHISMLQELLITLATSIKKRGAFPLHPSKNDLIFVPLSFEIPLASQLQEVDLVLHKITDEIINIDPNSSISFPKGISFSPGMSEIISSLVSLTTTLYVKQVESFCGSELQKQLAEENLSFPLIVKPQVACGVADAHNMEYIDHGSKIFKFYAIGDKIFHAIKNSMPNASHLKSSSGGKPLTFNSLKTLPVATKEQQLQNMGQDSKLLDINLVEEAAKLLKEFLGLTIFGFDVVVQETSGDHVIVDLNYLPSFKEVPDSEAMPAFWDAIKQSYDSRKQMMQT